MKCFAISTETLYMNNTTLNSTHTTSRISRLRGIGLGIVAVAALSACSSNEAPSAAAFEAPVTETAEVVEATSATETVEIAEAPVEMVSTEPTVVVATTQPPPPTTTTIQAPLVVKTASDYENSVPVLLTQLSVQTEPGDPLNVRTGAGVGNEIVAALDHGTSDLTATDYVILESGAQWNYVSQNGAPIGWVNAAYLTSPSPTAHCVMGADFPTFEGAVTTTTADVDLDGSVDEVFVLAQSVPTGGYDAWVLVSFGNGGVATGHYTGSYFDPIPTSSVYVTNLTALEQAPMNEIVLQLGSGASHAQYAVMALDNCALVTTTLNGTAFAFTNGASAGHSTVSGCNYGAHGKVEFTTTSMDFNADDWSSETFELTGTQWLSVATSSKADFPNITAGAMSQSAASLFDCSGIS